MARRTLHERFLIDGATDSGTAPVEYLTAMDGAAVRRTTTLHDAISTIDHDYAIERRPLASRPAPDDVDTEAQNVPGWYALVNPRWYNHDNTPPAGRESGVWHVATDEYTPASPNDVWGPLVSELRDADVEVFGELRLSRDGGNQHLDLYFPEFTVEYGDFEHVLGISSEHGYFGDKSHSAEIIAVDSNQDLRGRNPKVHTMRGLTDTRRRKHTGTSPSDVADWWDVTMEVMDEVSDALYGLVTDAMEYEVDIGALPCTIEEFYEHLGLPNSSPSTVASDAASRALKTVEGGYDAFHLHRAAMHALENTYDTRDTSAFAQHTATINDLLFDPPGAERSVINSLSSEIEAERTSLMTEDGAEVETDWDELESDREALVERVETIPDGVDEVQSARQRMKRMFADAESGSEEADA